jgi:methionyl-tRNA formyltransferase
MSPSMSQRSLARRPRAIVFAYHNVGVRCLRVLIDAGVEIGLVVTHRDNPAETIWFDSVAQVAAEAGLHCITPDDPNTPEVLALCREARPDFLFSFYYRHMLKAELLALAPAYNLHGSLLPKYRGRVPINWAVLHGERETGATLHVMDIKPDHGAIVDQMAVPILGDDTAHEVFGKVVVAAELVLARALPGLVDGSAVLTEQDLARGSYFGGRKPEQGRLPAAAGVQALHNLIRAVAPPYPGAFFDARVGGRLRRIGVLRSRITAPAGTFGPMPTFCLQCSLPGMPTLLTADGGGLQVLAMTLNGVTCDAAGLQSLAALTAQAPLVPISPVQPI